MQTQRETGDIDVVPLSEYEHTWKPFANKDNIYKLVQTPQGAGWFIIDPWTQRWLIAKEPVPKFLMFANGHRPLSEIVHLLSANHDAALMNDEFQSIIQDLLETGILFNNQAEWEASGLPVYNTCEPIGMHLEITNGCNMTCTHCYVSSGKKLFGEMTFEQICRVIDMLPRFSGKRVAISGGEPAVRRDCAEIIRYCVVNCGHDVDLYTNGKNFPRQLAESLADINQNAKAKIRIQMSLEGATPLTNDMVRGKGSYAAAMKTMNLFKELGLNRYLVLFVCLSKHNIGEVDELISLSKDMSVSMLVFSQWQKQGNASSTPWQSIAPSVEEWVSVGEKILKRRDPHLAVFGNFYGDLKNNNGSFSLDGPLFPKHLYFYNIFPRISPDGHAWADQMWVDPEWILGNLKTDTLNDCFDSPKFNEQLREISQRGQKIRECNSCEWNKLCEGGSPGHTYAEYGNLNHKDWFCESRIYWFNRFISHQINKSYENSSGDTDGIT